MLVLDTHVLVWLDEGNPRLGTNALQTINRALASGQLGVASISFWEIAMLVRKKRLDIQIELDVWRIELLQNVGHLPLKIQHFFIHRKCSTRRWTIKVNQNISSLSI
jgi:PIN domain nuclease of toxin-antitoxin system